MHFSHHESNKSVYEANIGLFTAVTDADDTIMNVYIDMKHVTLDTLC